MGAENGKSEKIFIITGACLIVLLAAAILWKGNMIGVPGNGLERDARKSMNIEDCWEAVEDADGDIGAVLFYGSDREECTYAVYLNYDGGSIGYFFREGGAGPYISEGVQEIIYADKGTVLLSMNVDGINRIVIEEDAATQTIGVDPDKPFAVVLPINCGEITLYDADGNIVEGKLYDRYTG